MSAKRKLAEIQEAALTAVKDDDGRFHQKELEQEIARRIATLPEADRAVVFAEFARVLAVRVVNKHKPKDRTTDSGQITLFDDDSILKLGDNKRVEMPKSKADDVLAWTALAGVNVERVVAAYNKQLAYASSRVAAFRDYPDKNLGEIERDVFGHVQPDESDDTVDLDDDGADCDDPEDGD
jgi:hypothetical protein